MSIVFLITSILKIVAILAYLYGLLWVLGRKQLVGEDPRLVAAFGVIQLAITPVRRLPGLRTTSTAACCSRPAPWPWSPWA